MIILIFSIITALIAILIAFAVAFRDIRRLSNISFAVGLSATVCVTFGDTMAVFRPEQLPLWKTVVFISESIMAPSWLLFTLSFARTSYRETTGKLSKLLLLLSPIFVILLLIMPQETFYYSPEFEDEKVLFLGNTGYIFNLLLLFYSIVSVINLEATLRSSSGIKRWQIKYMLLGVGGILGLSIFYYSHALLYRSIDMGLLPVRIGVLLILSLLLGFSILRHKFMDVEVTVSRGVFYKSLSIFFIGFYLLGLGLIGEGMRYLGPGVGKNITAFLGFTGAIGILVLMLSEQLRKKVMVFINKNFYSQKYDYRAQWLQFTQRISSKHSFDGLLSSITEGFKDAIGARSASVWLREEGNGEYYCAKAVDIEVPKVKPGKEIIDFLKDKGWVFNVKDNKSRAIAFGNTAFIENTRASLIIPLQDKGNLIGFIILGHGLAGDDYNYEDYDLLKTLARQATSAIMNASLTEELTEAREMEAVGKLSSFIMHDLKNATSMLSLIAQNAEEHIDDPVFQRDAMKSVANTSEKIKSLMQKLRDLPHKMRLSFEYADLGVTVNEVVRELNLNGNAMLDYEEGEAVKTMFDREEIRKVVLNLVINAIDASTGKEKVKIKVGIEDGMGLIIVSDNGVGMSKEFIEAKLFRPFQTTKKKGLGVGLYQCKTIVEAHSGKMKVKSTEGEGTDFFVYLPIRLNESGNK
jgi:putative PEP-CTERM system histidine kinase